ncbi:hypothetical protein Pan97_18890 [Bremerella volcania]|uniref:Uncharacterized protein n=1 Tax=Bremerella volcania TaxID=2527984 RepID=A0A518C6M6_9BACT|nr:hypothetical protein Pan97_18890 [Bremerella volcania]
MALQMLEPIAHPADDAAMLSAVVFTKLDQLIQ